MCLRGLCVLIWREVSVEENCFPLRKNRYTLRQSTYRQTTMMLPQAVYFDVSCCPGQDTPLRNPNVEPIESSQPLRTNKGIRMTQNNRSFILMIFFCLLLCLHTCTASSRRLPGEDEISRRGPEEEESESQQSKLTDVWLCLACALGWTMWMVANHVRPVTERYSTEGIVVYGNVLQTNVVEQYSGIPTYHAVIDYVLEDEDSTQVRKELKTDVLLEEGFANVELLVLPTDPTSGILKKDWEREYETFRETERSRKNSRKGSFALGAVLVTLSIIGAIKAVQRLPVEMSIWGWVCLVSGVALLWPVAVLLYTHGSAFARMASQSKQEGGVIIRGKKPRMTFPFDFLKPCVSMTDSKAGTQKVENRKSTRQETELTKSSKDLILPPHLTKFDPPKDLILPPHLAMPMQVDPNVIEKTQAGCYFINLPRQQQSQHSSVSSVSTASKGDDVDEDRLRQTGFHFIT